MSRFVFSSLKLLALKARQLRKAFPFLRLSTAQEATARCLGYASWFDCLKTGTTGTPSASDQEAGLQTRVLRYYHQAGVLVSFGIHPANADVWVRGWGLTGDPTYPPSVAAPVYYRWKDAAGAVQRGDLTDSEIEEEWGFSDGTKYPEVDRPVEVCKGVVLSPLGKYPHYAIDPAILARSPAYLVGSWGLYHYEDSGPTIKGMVPDFKDEFDTRWDQDWNLVHHEWQFETKHPDVPSPILPQLIEAALAAPDAMVGLSVRCMFLPDGEPTIDRFAVACLRGGAYAEFLRAKGRLNHEEVVWFTDIEDGDPALEKLRGHIDFTDGRLPIFRATNRHRPSLPLYSYPFKEGPMAEYELTTIYEMTPLLPLDQDYQFE